MKSRLVVSVAIVLAGVLIISAYALTQITTQTIPSVGLSAGLYSNCTTLVMLNGPTVPSSNPGFADFHCPSSNQNFAPLNVTDISYGYTPTFTLPAPYISLNVTSAGLCNGGIGWRALTSGQPVTFPCALTGSQGYYYYVRYSSVTVSGLPSFTITWSG